MIGMGYHYGDIVCGDSDRVLDELIKMGVRFDLVIADPPYNLKKEFGNGTDCLPVPEYIRLTKERIGKVKEILSPYGSVIWFGIHDYICYPQIAMYEAGLFYRRMNIWHYTNGFSRSSREPATHYEPFLWFSKNDRKWTYNTDMVRVPYKSRKRLEHVVTYNKADGTKGVWTPNPKGAMRGDVWEYPVLAGKRFSGERTPHPTQKPESLITEIIKAFCPMKDGIYNGTILDPFLGSGTTAVCCRKLNLCGHDIKWLGIEMEGKWCEIANERLVRADEDFMRRKIDGLFGTCC